MEKAFRTGRKRWDQQELQKRQDLATAVFKTSECWRKGPRKSPLSRQSLILEETFFCKMKLHKVWSNDILQTCLSVFLPDRLFCCFKSVGRFYRSQRKKSRLWENIPFRRGQYSFTHLRYKECSLKQQRDQLRSVQCFGWSEEQFPAQLTSSLEDGFGQCATLYPPEESCPAPTAFT